MSVKSKSSATIVVELLRGDKVMRTYQINEKTATIGTGAQCSITIAGDNSIQEHHATLYVEAGELHLVPEEQAQILFNGQPADFVLPDKQDTITLGRISMRAYLERVSREKGRIKKTLFDALGVTPPQDMHEKKLPEIGVDEQRDETVRMESPFAAEINELSKADHDKTVSLKAVKEVQKKQDFDKTVSMRALKKPVRPQEIDEEHTIDEESPATESPVASIPAEKTDAPKKKRTPRRSTLKQASQYVSNFFGDIKQSALKRRTTVQEDDFQIPEDDTIDVSQIADNLDAVSAYDDDYYFSDDEWDEFHFQESFDLRQELEAPVITDAQAPAEDFCVVNIVRIIDERIVEAARAIPGDNYKSLNKEIRCASKNNAANIFIHQSMTGEVNVGNSVQPLQDYPLKRKYYRLQLTAGQTAQFTGQMGTYRINVFNPPAVPKSKEIVFDKFFVKILAVAFGLHLILGTVVAVVQTTSTAEQEEVKEEVFATVKLEDEKVEKPKPKKKPPPPPPRPKSTLQLSEKAPAVAAKTWKRISTRRPPKGTASVGSLLKVLSKNSGSAGASNNIKDLVSNIDAAPSGAGGRSSFRIAGAIASLPGEKGVNIARKGGGGIISTLSGDEVAGKKSGVARLAMSGKRTTVRGQVTKMSSGARVSGRLSRTEVLQVINSHFHEVQGCYERALISKNSLSGRIVFEWVITTSGTVRGVRVRSSSLNSTSVASCISSKIRRWRFPKPQGGEVTISFPFLFRAVSS